MRHQSILPLLLSSLIWLLTGISDVCGQSSETERRDTTEGDDEWNGDWTLDSLKAEDFDLDDERFSYLSRGWFPTPFRRASFGSSLAVGDVYDRSSDLRTRAFVPTAVPFGWRNPYRGSFIEDLFGFRNKERTILKPYSDEAVDGGYPAAAMFALKFHYVHYYEGPVSLRFDLGVRGANGFLFSEDTTRSHLSLSGVPRSFREIGVVHLTQWGFSGTAGIQIPVYGVFLADEFDFSDSVGSYYYLFSGLAGDYVASSMITQYAQIADAKDEIRYGNGQDTVTLMENESSERIRRARGGIEVGIGWAYSTNDLEFWTELFLFSPLNSIVDDGVWKEYYGGLRLFFAYDY